MPTRQMLITHAAVVTMTTPNQFIEDAAVLISNGIIQDIVSHAELRAKYPHLKSTLDAKGKYLLPGNICAHTHFYSAFARGMAVPGKPAKNFMEVLKKLWWKLDRALDIDGVRASAQVAMVDAIKHGTTTLIDHHASPNAIDGSLDAIADAATEAGLRAALCYEVTDRNGLAGAAEGLHENARFAQLVQAPNNGFSNTVKAAMGLHASFTVGDKTLDACVGAAHDLNIPIHIHVAEDAADEAHAQKHFGKSVVERLKDMDALDDMSMLAHCIHIDKHEMKLIAEAGAKVMHQPRSNMNNGVGVAPISKMLKHGICVGLGNDGFSNNAFAEMKACDMLHKLHSGDLREMGADKVVKMVYENNTEIANLFWPGQNLGALKAGAPADLVLMDYTPYTDLNADNLPWHMLFGMDGSMVTHTLCNGQLLMKDRELLTLDEAEIAAKALEASHRAWQRVAEL